MLSETQCTRFRLESACGWGWESQHVRPGIGSCMRRQARVVPVAPALRKGRMVDGAAVVFLAVSVVF